MGRFAPGAWRYALAGFGLSLPAAVFSPLATVALVVLGVASLLFHRDPDRSPPPEGVLAPADGRISVVREESGVIGEGEVDGGDRGVGEEGGGDRIRIGVFMNVTDVHVNRAPLGGRVEEVVHEPGKHRPAFTKDSDRNEKLHVRFPDHEVTLVAGAFARRIHSYVDAGDELDRGERLGHISFGSRADVLLPPSVDAEDVAVERGQKVRAGETVLAEETALARES